MKPSISAILGPQKAQQKLEAIIFQWLRETFHIGSIKWSIYFLHSDQKLDIIGHLVARNWPDHYVPKPYGFRRAW